MTLTDWIESVKRLKVMHSC